MQETLAELVRISPALLIAAALVGSQAASGSASRAALLQFALLALVLVLLVVPLSKALAERWGVGQLRPRCRSTGRDCQGMPSGHAMFAGFLTGYVASLLELRGDVRWPAAVSAYSALIVWQRVDSAEHSWGQVAVGYALGLGLGVLGGVWAQRRAE